MTPVWDKTDLPDVIQETFILECRGCHKQTLVDKGTFRANAGRLVSTNHAYATSKCADCQEEASGKRRKFWG